MKPLLPATGEPIERRILLVRGHRILLDADLAELYGVTIKQLNQAVKRNKERFPEDFMFQLTNLDWEALRSQTVTSNNKRGGRRYRPYAFMEQGVAMLSSVLRSARAIQANVEIMRAFVRFRRLLPFRIDLAQKLQDLEKKCEKQFSVVFEAIRQLMEPPPESPKKRIGFHS